MTAMTLSQFNAATGTDGDIISNNFEGDPLFVDAANGDFHLREGSAAINAGINVGLTKDYDGNSIVGLPDIGAFEYP